MIVEWWVKSQLSITKDANYMSIFTIMFKFVGSFKYLALIVNVT